MHVVNYMHVHAIAIAPQKCAKNPTLKKKTRYDLLVRPIEFMHMHLHIIIYVTFSLPSWYHYRYLNHNAEYTLYTCKGWLTVKLLK